MNRSSTIALIIVAVLLIGGGIFLATRSTSPTASPSPSVATSLNPTPTPADQNSGSSSAASPAATAGVMTYTAAGFSPSSVTVTAGQTFSVKNDSNSMIQVDSNPHPAHTDNPQLNIGPIAPGATGTVTLTRAGTWGIHNHLNPSNGATVVVQ